MNVRKPYRDIIRSLYISILIWFSDPDRLYYYPREGIENYGKVPNLNRLQQHAAQFKNFGKFISVGHPTFFTLFSFDLRFLRKSLID
jgi:hypothetical protein